MKLLVIGGTRFIGYWLVQAALEKGHDVTLFNRGQSNPHLFPQLERIRGTRAGGLDALRGRTWDVVIDSVGYLPRSVRASSKLLANSVEHYTFVSTASVYADFAAEILDETSQVARMLNGLRNSLQE